MFTSSVVHLQPLLSLSIMMPATLKQQSGTRLFIVWFLTLCISELGMSETYIPSFSKVFAFSPQNWYILTSKSCYLYVIFNHFHHKLYHNYHHCTWFSITFFLTNLAGRKCFFSSQFFDTVSKFRSVVSQSQLLLQAFVSLMT